MAEESHRVDQDGVKCTEPLHLFKPHYVRTAVPEIRDAGHDRFALRRPDECLGDLVDSGRARYVGRHLPAAVRPDHSGEEERMIAKAIANLGHGALKVALADREDALMV